MKSIIRCLSSIIIVFFATTVFANTPDGDNPPEEFFQCNVTNGTDLPQRLAGRYEGLCNAYCNATDCGDNVANASTKACMKLKDNLNAAIMRVSLAQPDEPILPIPCEVEDTTCSCLSLETPGGVTGDEVLTLNMPSALPSSGSQRERRGWAVP